MRTNATNKKLRELLNGIRTKALIPDLDFQRRLVWTNRHKVAFIETVLGGYPFPEVYIAAGEVNPDTGEAVEYLVDGQQRISTLYQYFTGAEDLRLGRSLMPFKELSDDKKREFLQYDVVLRDLGAVSREQILEVFTRINSTSYTLNAMEVHNARYDGALKRFVEALALSTFFEEHRTFTATDIRRMNDLRFSAWIVITIISSYFNRDEEVEEYLRVYNDEFPHDKQVASQLDEVFALIESCQFADS